MPISEKTIKLLWGRAGGMCSKPGCPENLTTLLESGDYTTGQMAHVIPQSPLGPRGDEGKGDDNYSNLILLCPNDHSHIDQSPTGTYPAELLYDWKAKHEKRIADLLKIPQYEDYEGLHKAIVSILIANKLLFNNFGPKSEIAHRDPCSNSYKVWEDKRINIIVPNNRKILNILDKNRNLISDSNILVAIEEFRVHVEGFEKHVEHRLDFYPQFPQKFGDLFHV